MQPSGTQLTVPVRASTSYHWCKILGQIASMARSLSLTTSGNRWEVQTGTPVEKISRDW
jgi:hypothetical protein